MYDELLTTADRRAMDKLSVASGAIHTAIYNEVASDADRAVAMQDWAEMCVHIHALQNAVLANVAARAFPTKYRTMGSAALAQSWERDNPV
jgi:hypothetical protein